MLTCLITLEFHPLNSEVDPSLICIDLLNNWQENNILINDMMVLKNKHRNYFMNLVLKNKWRDSEVNYYVSFLWSKLQN